MAAGWNADPTGRHALRYFDGMKWTDDVSDGSGAMTKDAEPIATAPPVVPPPGYVPPPPGSAYGQVQFAYTPAKAWNGLAIAGFVLSIVWMYGLGSILAVIFGHISRSQIKRDGKQGSGLALAGLIIGYLGLVGAAIIIAAVIVTSTPSDFHFGSV